MKFVRQRSDEELPETEIGVGDLVMLSKRDPLREDNPTGTVTAVTNLGGSTSRSRGRGERP
ncbi:hypothetical protein [Halalkalicoccus salilacus]|uniref:hypothetical protein n=1 Tax=Halalkalicoccus sp. GCM10025704 TaxID=3252662 RepID=UPI00361D97B2